jgi:tetratricopeptide (TPR) repeat protein
MIPRAFFLLLVFFAIKGQLYSQTIGASRDMALTFVQLIDRGDDLMTKNKLPEARQCFDAAIRLDPKLCTGYFHRGQLLRLQSQWAAAAQDFDTAVRLQPNFFAAAIMRGNTYANLKMYDRALADFNRILHLAPVGYTRAAALDGRAWLEATCANPAFRNGQQACADSRGACNITNWREASFIDTLAAAYAEKGDFDSAVKFENRAIALDPNEKEVPGSKQRLAMFQHHQPIRQGSG